jgi:hypothetical protein
MILGMGFSTSDPILDPDAVADLSSVGNTYTYINFGDFVARWLAFRSRGSIHPAPEHDERHNRGS